MSKSRSDDTIIENAPNRIVEGVEALQLSYEIKNLTLSNIITPMTPPDGSTVYDGELAKFWIDEEGILCAVSKMVPRTLERQKVNYELIRKITGNKRVCLLADNTLTYEQDEATRQYMASEMPKLFKAMAVTSRTVFGQAVSDTFFYYEGTPVPIKTFKDENEARDWLRLYLDK